QVGVRVGGELTADAVRHLIRWAGFSAVVGGGLFWGIQPIHPPEILSSFTTSTWAIVHYVGVVMCFFILLGITGIYARQVKEAGGVGLVGFLLFSLMWALTAAFQFAEGLMDAEVDLAGGPVGHGRT